MWCRKVYSPKRILPRLYLQADAAVDGSGRLPNVEHRIVQIRKALTKLEMRLIVEPFREATEALIMYPVLHDYLVSTNVQPLSFYRSLSFVNFSARSASRSPFSQCLKILQDSRLSRFSTEVERFFVELLKALSLFFWRIHPLRKFMGRNWNFGIAKLLELILMIWRRFISTKDRFFSNRGKLHLC